MRYGSCASAYGDMAGVTRPGGEWNAQPAAPTARLRSNVLAIILKRRRKSRPVSWTDSPHATRPGALRHDLSIATPPNDARLVRSPWIGAAAVYRVADGALRVQIDQSSSREVETAVVAVARTSRRVLRVT